MKKRKLTPPDRKKLKYATRTGYAFGGLIIIATLATYLIIVFALNKTVPLYFFLPGLALALLTGWLINRKWWTDLKINEKIIINKKAAKKESVESYAAGSSVGISTSGKKSPLYSGRSSKMKYFFIIENTRYEVDQQLWNDVQENETVEFHYASKSNDLLGIYKRNKSQ